MEPGQDRRVRTIHDPRYRAVIERLASIRREMRLTQEALALRLTGFTQPDVSKVEAGQRRLDVVELLDWVRALDYEFDQFLQEVGLIDR